MGIRDLNSSVDEKLEFVWPGVEELRSQRKERYREERSALRHLIRCTKQEAKRQSKTGTRKNSFMQHCVLDRQ